MNFANKFITIYKIKKENKKDPGNYQREFWRIHEEPQPASISWMSETENRGKGGKFMCSQPATLYPQITVSMLNIMVKPKSRCSYKI